MMNRAYTYNLFQWLLLLVVVMSVGLVSCSKDVAESAPGDGQISLSAVVGTITAESEAQNAISQTKAPALNTDMHTLYFARANETAAGTYGNYAATALTATRAAGLGAQPLSFSTAQYYNVSGLKTKLSGWFPGGATTAGDVSGKGYYNGSTRTVSWTINGEQDVMTAIARVGSVASPIPNIEFNHRLTQLLFHPYAETQSAIDSWGKIIKIEVLNQRNIVSYALTDDATGAVTFSGEAKNIFSAGIPTAGQSMSLSSAANKLTNAKQMGNAIMIEPQSDANHTLELCIYTDKNIMKTVSLTQALIAGTPYRLYLRFTDLSVIIEASIITEWGNVTTDDKHGYMRVGDYYYTDGTTSPKIESGKLLNGIIYYINSLNPKKFKVMSLDEPLNDDGSAKRLHFGILDFYMDNSNGVGSDAYSLTDGKANIVGLKAYSTNNVANIYSYLFETTGIFDIDFPAAAYCDNYKGKYGTDAKGTWYLPAKTELQYLYCAYNDIDTMIWDGVTDAPPVNENAHKHWNALLDKAGGTMINDWYYWSSTDPDDFRIWDVDFQYGYSDKASISPERIFNVRCVRDIAPYPSVGDYYFTDGSYSSRPQYGQIPNGMVFWVDPADHSKFKVLALDGYGGEINPNDPFLNTSLLWETGQIFVEGGFTGAHSETNGRANSAKIKDVFDSKLGTMTFDEVYPAAAYCYNYTGKYGTDAKGTWYLPAKDELQYLYCACNNIAPVTWSYVLNENAPEPNPSEQDTWDYALEMARGTAVTKGYYLSSTELIDETSPGILPYVWDVGISDGEHRPILKNEPLNVRCIRDI